MLPFITLPSQCAEPLLVVVDVMVPPLVDRWPRLILQAAVVVSLGSSLVLSPSTGCCHHRRWFSLSSQTALPRRNDCC
ncbi:Translation initiation factor IF-2, related [Sesbania bispinosa]|nr:Translation initiation factor IF-2, related [Sesbania bispinosa]